MIKQAFFPLRTGRLVLRSYRPIDLDEMQAYAGDEEVTRHLPWGPNTREATEEFLAQKIGEQEQWPREECTLALTLAVTGELIGGIRLGIKDPVNRTADIGYVLNRRYWGQGYVTEAARALLAVAFGELGLHRVWARCDVENPGSWRVMEKLGMRREGELRSHIQQRGEWRSSYLYAILEEEWNERNSPNYDMLVKNE